MTNDQSIEKLEEHRLVLREKLARAWAAREPLEDIAVIEVQLREVWRAIAWRCSDSRSLQSFLGYAATDTTPNHSSLTVIR